MSCAETRNILNVGINALRREISLRFKILSRKYHPDKCSTDLTNNSYELFTMKFQYIANARDLLVN